MLRVSRSAVFLAICVIPAIYLGMRPAANIIDGSTDAAIWFFGSILVTTCLSAPSKNEARGNCCGLEGDKPGFLESNPCDPRASSLQVETRGARAGWQPGAQLPSSVE